LRLQDEDEEEGTVTNRYSIDNDDEDDHSDYRGHAQGVGHNNQDYEEDEEEEFNPFLFIKSLPPYPYAIPPGWTSRSKALPPAHPEDPPICLVLDLDETLVHCTVEPIRGADMVFPVEFNGMEYTVVSQCCLFKLLYSLDS
jgi:CTD small phosphatase-like protein 2